MKFFRKTAAILLAVLVMHGALATAFADENDGSDTSASSEAATEPEETVTFTTVDEIVYATTAVNIRTGPGMDYQILTTMERGESIRRTGVGDNGWSRVLYRGEEAYMYTQFLSTKDPVTGMEANAGSLDTSRLMRQIAIANGLKEGDYSGETWEDLKAALEAANIALTGTSQEQMDSAAAKLEAAITALVGVDYSALEQALSKARQTVAASGEHELATQLGAAMAEAERLRSSGDQAAVDACTENINALLAQLEEYMKTADGPNVVIQEVEVEVPPTDDYCNIPSHRVWPVLFFCSLAVNVVLGAVLLLIFKKKSHRGEDVPLVDYDIDDDI